MREVLAKPYRLARFFLLTMPLMVMTPMASVCADQQPDRASVVKAKIMHAFTNFVTWPADQLGERFSMCVLNEQSSLLDPLRYFFNNTPDIQGRTPLVQSVALDTLTECQMLFIDTPHKDVLNTILATTRNLPILTFSDQAGYGQAGVLINFYIDGGNIRFEVNRDTVLASTLSIQAKALGFARIIRGGQ